MAKKVQAILNLEVVAGKAQPAPPLGPMLGANGVNIGAFIQEFNSKTQEYMQKFQGSDVKIKCRLTVFNDRTFNMELLGPVTSNLIKRKTGLKKGAGEPNKEELATLTRADLEEIAEIQKDSMNASDIEAIIRIIGGTAKNMGVKIEAGAIKEKVAA